MNWSQELSEITLLFKKNFESLNSEQLNYKPNPNTWSIAQNIAHIIQVNESYYPTFNAILQGKHHNPKLAYLHFIPSFIGKSILQGVQPDRKKKIKTFPIWEPVFENKLDNIVIRFTEHQQELTLKIRAMTSLINNKIVISSPANKAIIYPLDIALDIIVSHEKRHLEQAREIIRKEIII
ncbi:MAG: DinB family protein [Bacteroidetes bacterium]|nr:DinB family protein [Bacteroidota bacterium]